MPEMFSRSSKGKRRKTTDKCAVERVRGAKGAPWKASENDGKRTTCSWNRVRVKKFRERAEEEKQAGKQGQWQLESPAEEYLDQVKRSDDTCCTERMMKKGFAALKSGDWEEHKGIFRAPSKKS